MHEASLTRGGRTYDFGGYDGEEESRLATEVGALLLHKFVEPGTPPSSDLAQHPDVQELLAAPSLDAALERLRSNGGCLAKQLAIELGRGSYADEDAPPNTAPQSPAAETEGAAQQATQDQEESVMAALGLEALAKGAPAPSPARSGSKSPLSGGAGRPDINDESGGLPKRWVEWPAGSGSYACVIAKSNFPHRIVASPRQVWVMRRIFGAAVLNAIHSQPDDVTSKEEAVVLEEDSGAEHDITLRWYHNSTGKPYYVTPQNFFRKHSLAIGDVLIFSAVSPGRARVELWRAKSDIAAGIHRAVDFDLSSELTGSTHKAKRRAKDGDGGTSNKKARSEQKGAPANGVPAVIPVPAPLAAATAAKDIAAISNALKAATAARVAATAPNPAAGVAPQQQRPATAAATEQGAAASSAGSSGVAAAALMSLANPSNPFSARVKRDIALWYYVYSIQALAQSQKIDISDVVSPVGVGRIRALLAKVKSDFEGLSEANQNSIASTVLRNAQKQEGGMQLSLRQNRVQYNNTLMHVIQTIEKEEEERQMVRAAKAGPSRPASAPAPAQQAQKAQQAQQAAVARARAEVEEQWRKSQAARAATVVAAEQQGQQAAGGGPQGRAQFTQEQLRNVRANQAAAQAYHAARAAAQHQGQLQMLQRVYAAQQQQQQQQLQQHQGQFGGMARPASASGAYNATPQQPMVIRSTPAAGTQQQQRQQQQAPPPMVITSKPVHPQSTAGGAAKPPSEVVDLSGESPADATTKIASKTAGVAASAPCTQPTASGASKPGATSTAATPAAAQKPPPPQGQEKDNKSDALAQPQQQQQQTNAGASSGSLQQVHVVTHLCCEGVKRASREVTEALYASFGRWGGATLHAAAVEAAADIVQRMDALTKQLKERFND